MPDKFPRRADGGREIRGIDDMIRAEFKDLPIHRLPGAGAPIDLTTYFASSPELRVGNKLLSDNQILPPTVAERRHLEQCLCAAAAVLREHRPVLRRDLGSVTARAMDLAEGGNNPIVMSLLEPFALPPCAVFRSARVDSTGIERTLNEVDALVRAVEHYGGRRRYVASRYRHHLQEAGRICADLSRISTCERVLNPLPIPNPDLAALRLLFEREFPCLPVLPADLQDRLRRCRDRHAPGWWRRLLNPSSNANG